MTTLSANDCQSNLNDGVSNILAMFGHASAAEIRNGRAWYAVACDDAHTIAALYNVPVLTVVKVACALSPRLKWEQNMIAAEEVIRHYCAGGYVPSITPYAAKAMMLQRTRYSMNTEVIADDPNIPFIKGPTKVNIVKALWILQGHDWVLRGPKVNSFLDNILNHATSDAVTVDSHAIQVWFGRLEKGTYTVPNSYYQIIAADYRKAAAMVALTPLQLQAITWLTKKRLSVKTKAGAAAFVSAIEKMLA